MPQELYMSSGLLMPAVAFVLAGCNQNIAPPNTEGKIMVADAVGNFVMNPDEVKQGKGILPAARVSRSGTAALSVQPSDLSIEPEFNDGGTIEVSAAFGEVEGFGEACAEPVVAYPPFTITVDEDGQITDISPSNFDVENSIVDLVAGGEFTLCVTVSSTITGRVDINSFTLD